MVGIASRGRRCRRPGRCCGELDGQRDSRCKHTQRRWGLWRSAAHVEVAHAACRRRHAPRARCPPPAIHAVSRRRWCLVARRTNLWLRGSCALRCRTASGGAAFASACWRAFRTRLVGHASHRDHCRDGGGRAQPSDLEPPLSPPISGNFRKCGRVCRIGIPDSGEQAIQTRVGFIGTHWTHPTAGAVHEGVSCRVRNGGARSRRTPP